MNKRNIKIRFTLLLISIFSVSFFSQGNAQTLEERVDALERENKILKQKIMVKEEPTFVDAPKDAPETFTRKDRENIDFLTAVHKRVQPFGSLALRYHSLHYLSNVQSMGIDFSHIDAHFARIDAQVRLGVKGHILDDLQYQIRLGTGNTTSPASGWVALDSFFNKNPINLDRYYFDWNPNFYEPLRVLLGKFQNPVSGTQLIWDDDAGIQGINVLFDAGKHTGGDFIEQLALGGLFYYLEDYTGDAHDDVFMAGPTFQSRFAVADSVKLTFNLSYYDTHNADGIAQAIGSGALSTAQGAFATSNLTAIGPVNIGGATPATLVGTGFASDFNLLNPYIELALMTGSVPVKFFVDQVWNIGAAGFGATHDYGIMTGTKIGDNGKPGSPWVGYQFAWIEADATFDAFNDDQIGTNIISHYLEGGIRIAKNLKLFATLNFHKDLNPLFRGYGDAMGTQIPGILVPIHDDPWAVRSRAYIAASF